jgi:hypothetical protein
MGEAVMREKFEAWLTGGKPSAAKERKATYEGLCGWDEYSSTHTAAMWEAWQAAYATGMERAAEICDHPDAIDADDCAALIRYEITKGAE